MTHNETQFLFESEWEGIAPATLKLDGFRKIASEFVEPGVLSRNNDLAVKILLLYSKVFPTRVRNRAVHDFLANFSEMKGKKYYSNYNTFINFLINDSLYLLM